MRKLGIRTTARAIGLLAVGAAIVATDVYVHRGGVIPVDRRSAAATIPLDPLARELRRCSAIGIKAENDAACEAAWAENRRRFFAPPPERTPADAMPASDAGRPR